MHEKQFDALRGVAAIVVLLAHVVQVFQYHELAGISSAMAYGAVLVFFLLSGYLVTLSIRTNIDRHGTFAWRPYAVSRITRIYPPFIGAIGVTLLAWALARALGLPPGRLTISAMDVPRALLMQNGLLQANGPLWSLYMEFHIYIIAMMVALRGRWIWIGVVLFAFWTWRAPEFALWCAAWGIGAAANLWRIPRIPVPGWLAATGDFSYSLYVVHFPLLLLAWSVSPTTAMALIATPVVLGIAMLFARYFEQQARFRPVVAYFVHRVS